MTISSSARGRENILFVSSAERPGADTFIHVLLMRELDRSRYEVHVAFSAGRPGRPTVSSKDLAGIPDLHLRPTNFGPSLHDPDRGNPLALVGGALLAIISLIGLALYVRRHRIRVIHSTDRARDALSCVLLGRVTGAKSVVHVHLGYGEWMSKAVRWSFRRADARVCISRFVARSLVANGCPPLRTYVVLNSIDVAMWDPGTPGDTVRRELGLSVTSPVVTCIGRIFPGKGQGELIRAIAIVRDELPAVRLLIVGVDDRTATPGNRSFTSQLRELAAELGVAENVVFTGFRVDTAAVLAASDVFAMASFEEPFGLVFLEAMAMMRPVVGLNNGGTPEVVEDGGSGLLAVPGDSAALADRILRLLRDPALRREMGEYGRRQVDARFTARRMAEDTGRVYADLLAR